MHFLYIFKNRAANDVPLSSFQLMSRHLYVSAVHVNNSISDHRIFFQILLAYAPLMHPVDPIYATRNF